MDKVKKTIAMLLDIEHLYGEPEGRLAPVLTTILLCLAAPLFYVYFGAFTIIPIWLFAPIAVIIAIRVALLILGRENYRLEIYRRRQNDEYINSSTLMQIKQVHPDGCVEYINGKIFYAVCCYNGTIEDDIKHTQMLRKFLNTLFGDYNVDTYILNMNSTEPLRQYYSKTHKFGRNTAGRNFVKIIDNSVKMTKDNSMVQCTVYCIKGVRSDWKAIKTQVDAAIRSSSAKCFKSVYRVKAPEELQEIINMDADTSVNIEDLIRRRYKSGEYDSSRVIAYDPEEVVVIQEKAEQPPKQINKNKNGFYVSYKEDKPVEQTEGELATAKPEYYKPIIIGGSEIEQRREENDSTEKAGGESKEPNSTGEEAKEKLTRRKRK